jgi:hypothetical protein
MDGTLNELKSAAHQLIDALPSGATWDDLMYQVYVRQCIEAGLEDAKNGRVVDVDTVRAQFGLQG